MEEPAASLPRSGVRPELIAPAGQPVFRPLDRRRFGLSAALWRALGLATLAIGLSAALLLLPIDYAALGTLGYVGVFGATLLATGSLILPVPYLVVVGEASLALNPYLVALTAGLASAIGESTGYLLGVAGKELTAGQRWRQIAERGMQRYGLFAVFFLAFIPNPVFDAAGATAGALGYSWWRFMIAVFVGKTLRFLLLGAFSHLIAGFDFLHLAF